VDLSFPPTVSPSVTFYVAHSGGEDYQISRPVMNLAPGFQDRYAQTDVGAVFVPEDENLLVPSHKTQDVTAQTTGEYFRSLRSFVKRFGHLADLNQQENYVGLRTRHMTEDPTTGQRVMSQPNFTDTVLPTPWYMASFLYRFYNGSSQLKLIPYTAGVVCDAFLSFDEDQTSQIDNFPSISYGQPVFHQLQQMSNAFEVRTPYYRAIRCDVVDSNQTPILGDVRTNIRARNLASYGGNTQASPLFEAAGDDFNYFFMVGPPPMSDIRNVTSFSTFPTGNSYLVNLTGVTGIQPFGDVAFVTPAVYQPNLAEVRQYPIASSDLSNITITYTDATTAEILVTDCRLERTANAIAFVFPFDNTKTIDSVTTIAALRNLPLWNVVAQ
jgi:hypothetical protein